MISLQESERDHEHQTIPGNATGPNIVQAFVLARARDERGFISSRLRHYGSDG